MHINIVIVTPWCAFNGVFYNTVALLLPGISFVRVWLHKQQLASASASCRFWPLLCLIDSKKQCTLLKTLSFFYKSVSKDLFVAFFLVGHGSWKQTISTHLVFSIFVQVSPREAAAMMWNGIDFLSPEWAWPPLPHPSIYAQWMYVLSHVYTLSHSLYTLYMSMDVCARCHVYSAIQF